MNLTLTNPNSILVSISAIIAVTVLEVVAMITGQDGAFLLPIVAVISGLAGFAVGLPIQTDGSKSSSSTTTTTTTEKKPC